jgi:hypothetical protein
MSLDIRRTRRGFTSLLRKMLAMVMVLAHHVTSHHIHRKSPRVDAHPFCRARQASRAAKKKRRHSS